MSQRMKETFVMDVLPWPDGRGFSGADQYWQYVLSKAEQHRLDHLLGLALLDEEICDRLVNQRDLSLMMAHGLSTETQLWLSSLKVKTLTELAQAIMQAR